VDLTSEEDRVEQNSGRVQLVDPKARAIKGRFAMKSILIALGLFIGMLIFLEIGRQLGLQRIAAYGENGRHGVGVVDGVVFSLTALLLGFAFSGATSRFDQRRQLIANEANAAGTAWERIDTLPPDLQGDVRASLRVYLDELCTWYSEAPGSVAVLTQPAGLSRAQAEVWSRSVAACLTPPGEKARMLLLPSLSELFGAVDRERLARRMHPPTVIYALFIISGMASGLFGGYALAGGPGRPWLYMIGVAAAIAATTFLILQLEFPRLGLVSLRNMETALFELRATMNPRPAMSHVRKVEAAG
jgi:hypothetical protein